MMVQRKGLITHRSKENLVKLSHDRPRQRQASGTNPPIKALRQDYH